MTKEAGNIGLEPAPGVQLFTNLMLIIRFLPDNRKKDATRKKKSYSDSFSTIGKFRSTRLYKLILYTFVSRFSKPSAR